MSILSVVQKHCRRTGIPIPSALFGTQDKQALQILELAQEVVEDLCDRWTWSALTKETTFTTVLGPDQGAVTDYATEGYMQILQETMYNRTLRLPLFGPISEQEWQIMQALVTTGPFYKYKITDGKIWFNPAGVAGQLCAFSYKSSWACFNQAQTVYGPEFLADTDGFVLGDTLLLAGLRWKWKAEKGLDYAEELQRYEVMANNMSGADGTKKVLNMGSPDQQLRPGIWVASGNWAVSNGITP